MYLNSFDPIYPQLTQADKEIEQLRWNSLAHYKLCMADELCGTAAVFAQATTVEAWQNAVNRALTSTGRGASADEKLTDMFSGELARLGKDRLGQYQRAAEIVGFIQKMMKSIPAGGLAMGALEDSIRIAVKGLPLREAAQKCRNMVELNPYFKDLSVDAKGAFAKLFCRAIDPTSVRPFDEVSSTIKMGEWPYVQLLMGQEIADRRGITDATAKDHLVMAEQVLEGGLEKKEHDLMALKYAVSNGRLSSAEKARIPAFVVPDSRAAGIAKILIDRARKIFDTEVAKPIRDQLDLIDSINQHGLIPLPHDFIAEIAKKHGLDGHNQIFDAKVKSLTLDAEEFAITQSFKTRADKELKDFRERMNKRRQQKNTMVGFFSDPDIDSFTVNTTQGTSIKFSKSKDFIEPYFKKLDDFLASSKQNMRVNVQKFFENYFRSKDVEVAAVYLLECERKVTRRWLSGVTKLKFFPINSSSTDVLPAKKMVFEIKNKKSGDHSFLIGNYAPSIGAIYSIESFDELEPVLGYGDKASQIRGIAGAKRKQFFEDRPVPYRKGVLIPPHSYKVSVKVARGTPNEIYDAAFESIELGKQFDTMKETLNRILPKTMWNTFVDNWVPYADCFRALTYKRPNWASLGISRTPEENAADHAEEQAYISGCGLEVTLSVAVSIFGPGVARAFKTVMRSVSSLLDLGVSRLAARGIAVPGFVRSMVAPGAKVVTEVVKKKPTPLRRFLEGVYTVADEMSPIGLGVFRGGLEDLADGVKNFKDKTKLIDRQRWLIATKTDIDSIYQKADYVKVTGKMEAAHTKYLAKSAHVNAKYKELAGPNGDFPHRVIHISVRQAPSTEELVYFQ